MRKNSFPEIGVKYSGEKIHRFQINENVLKYKQVNKNELFCSMLLK